MPISATGSLTDPAKHRGRRPPGAARGFTLIELVAVMTVVAILALALVAGTGAGSLMGRERSSTAGAIAHDLETAVASARAAAFHTRLPHGLLPLPEGWQMLVRERASGGWRLAGEGRGTALSWVIDATAHFPATPAEGTPPRPRVIFASDGRATPFSVEIHSPQERLRCATDGWEALQCAPR